jgi:signal transduction histidine kinase
VPPSSPSKRASWSHRVHPPGAPTRDAPFAWIRHLHIVLALIGLAWFDPAQWPLYLLVLVLLSVEWPFCIRLADDVEVYFPVMWTAAGAAYILGPVVLAVYWIAGVLGFTLIVVLDGRRIVPAVGLAAESARRYRGEPFALESVVDGDLRHFLLMSELAVRVIVYRAASTFGSPFFASVVLAELSVAAWDRVVPIPGRMAPARARARLQAALGADIVRATRLLDMAAVCWLLLAESQGGPLAFAGASLMTLTLHAVLKRLSDTRGELGRRERLAVIGQTAATVFHQLGRHHGAIGMYAHLLARGATDGWPPAVGEHAARILVSVDEANRVVDDLLAFGQDRTLNLYPHALATVVEECLDECRARAQQRGVPVRVTETTDAVVTLDKHKIKQAIGNLLDNAIDAAPPGTPVELTATTDNGAIQVAVRDYGGGIAAEIRPRLFMPFCTTKPDGVGLGLALAKELVLAHGGELEWEPAEPGTKFVLSLPR